MILVLLPKVLFLQVHPPHLNPLDLLYLLVLLNHSHQHYHS